MKWLLILLIGVFLVGCVPTEAKYEYKLSDFGKSDCSAIIKIDNPSAKDVNLNELFIFLRDYDNQEHPYVGIPQACGYAAEDLHNIAEMNGIRAAIVVTWTRKDNVHLFNLFQTEIGKVYVDASSGFIMIAEREGNIYKIVRRQLDQTQIQYLGEEQDFLVFW